MPRDDDPRDRNDFGQADYSNLYGYDPVRRSGYRAEDGPAPRRIDEDDRAYARRMDEGDYRRAPAPRSWMERVGDVFPAGPAASPRRRGPSDRVLWAVIVERLEHERRLDLRDVELIVEGGEVTLNGTVPHKADKRRIEDVADIDGIRHVQNNLRVRGHAPWTFL